MRVNTVTVVGANGTMGCNVSAIFASFGNAKVYMVSRDMEASKRATLRAGKSVRADSIMKNLVAADYSMLEHCVSESDLVFESTTENMEVKVSIMKRVASFLRKDAIACSGTSGLSITKLAECFDEEHRGCFFGVHMFNPPYHMTLCEVTPTIYSNPKVLMELKNYLTGVLLRTVVEVKDSPAFLGNRIGFQFINEALIYAERYKYNGGIDYIDALLGPFTGRSMAPLTTSDFVGLDIHEAIVANLYQNTNDYAHQSFVFPEFAKRLIERGSLGRKAGAGLYKMEKYDNGLKRLTVYDILSDSYRDKISFTFPFTERMIAKLRNGNYLAAFQTLVDNRSQEAEICLGFLLRYIVYSLSATEEVGYDIHSADDVMATGFNWCPPLAMIKALSTVTDVKTLIKERMESSILNNVDVESLLERVEPSKYDYRLYFKSSR